MSHIIFAHANSFPAGTYQVLFTQLRARGFTVSAIERLGHDERYPVSNNWSHLAAHLAEFAAHERAQHGQELFLVGHSLGGFLSVMAAAQNPGLAQGVVMLDSPLIGGWRASVLKVAKRTRLVSAVSPGRVSRARRNSWSSPEEALEHFRCKKVFARWDPHVLQDYVTHGLDAHNGQYVLRFAREVETHIYNTLPHNLTALLQRHPLRCPAAFIGGRHSAEVRQAGMAMTERITQGRVMMLDGSHLFPMEQPLTTAAAIEASILNLRKNQRSTATS